MQHAKDTTDADNPAGFVSRARKMNPVQGLAVGLEEPTVTRYGGKSNSQLEKPEKFSGDYIGKKESRYHYSPQMYFKYKILVFRGVSWLLHQRCTLLYN